MDPLSQLNDIVELEHVSGWPLAWGWWLILAILLLTLVTSVVTYVAARKRSALLRASRKAIAQCESISDISTQLKIVALHYFMGQNVEQLSGLAWLHFLNQQLPNKHKMTTQYLNELSALMYTKNNQQLFDSYHSFAKLWLQHATIARGRVLLKKDQAHV